ncbi:MAG: peptidylprolyl isomerase [Oligoflexia bacterium]|nr:peptidylprolyl isomerase [Oligoflexia bacterium]
MVPAREIEEVSLGLGKGLYAIFDTTLGEIVCRLEEDKTPETVKNFVGLATGQKEYTDPRTNQKSTEPFYDGTIFHRIIKNFMVQGGDRLGQGTGGPGYRFKDEFHPSLKHKGPGILSMANAGPNTNGSQFFITLVPTPWLDGKHSVFGEIVKGQDVLMKLGEVPTGSMDRPRQEVGIRKLRIAREK